MAASILKSIYKSSCWAKVLFSLAIALLVLFVTNTFSERRKLQEGFTEGFRKGFTNEKPFVLKQNAEAFDEFYAGIYDDLLYNKIKNNL